MKSWKFFLAALAALTLVACGGKTPEPDPVRLSATPNSLTFEAAGGTQEVSITTDIKPDVSAVDSWISLKEGSLSNNTFKLTVTAQAYDGTVERKTSIRIIGNKMSLMIPVTQQTPPIKLAVDQSKLSFDRFGGEATLKVTSATQPTVTTDASWCGVEAGTISTSHETTVSVMASANRTFSPKTGTITITCGDETVTVIVSEEAGSVVPTATTTALTPNEVFQAMAPGWNLGNQMDAIDNGVASETVWGNPKCTQATMDGVKAAGFKAVRICVTWEGHIGPAPYYKIEDSWLNRVAEIVGYAEKAGLVAIVNTHHDESYWQDIKKAYNNTVQNEKVKDEMFCLWTQIAQRFVDKGEWLVFESFNEIQDGGWGWSAEFRKDPQAQYKVLNEWSQAFVDAVRSTGGNNATRWLGVSGYASNPALTIEGLVLPEDHTTENRLMVAVHDYDPYDYTLSSLDDDHPDVFKIHQWGHTADPGLRLAGDNEAAVVAVFDNLKAAYLDKGIPVYLGEMGCSRHADADYPYQKYYMEYFCKAAADRLLPMYVWDNGGVGIGPEKHGYIDHGTGKIVDKKAATLIETMVKAVTTADPAYTLESVYNSAP